jgi:glycosyltransferase involved in cell wall biosynthesis
MLARAVESALAAGEDVEVVVVDDASATDEAERVCRRYEGVRYVRASRNQRLGGARNIGLLASRGEFITFLDDDDARLPESINPQRRVLQERVDVGLVYGQALLESAEGRRAEGKYPESCPEGDIFWELMERNFIPCPSAMFRREALFKVGLPEDSTPGIEDWDYWLRIAELWPAAALDFPVAVYRKATPRSGQFTSDAAGLVRLITKTHEKKWMRLPRAALEDRRVRERARTAFSKNMATHLVWEAGRALARGDLIPAARNVWAAMTLHPAATLKLAATPANYAAAAGRLRRILTRS